MGTSSIEDSVLNYAFPSKTSSYVFSGSKILGICGKVPILQVGSRNKLGFVVNPKISEIVDFFSKLKKKK